MHVSVAQCQSPSRFQSSGDGEPVRCACHVRQPNKTSTKARNKLIIACILALFFMIGEVIGECHEGRRGEEGGWVIVGQLVGEKGFLDISSLPSLPPFSLFPSLSPLPLSLSSPLPLSPGGYLSDSLAILTDAAHMLSDFASFLISLFAIWVATRKPSKGMSFGWHRAGL